MALQVHPKNSTPIFILLAICGFYFVAFHMIKSRAPVHYLEVHKASNVPLTPTNGRFPAIDRAVSPLVSFFVAAFNDPSSRAFATAIDFVWSYSAAILLPLIEPQRISLTNGWSLSKTFLGSPLIWGLLYQRLSGGWIMPLWLFVFMHSPTRTNTGGVSRIGAESVFVGWWLGHTLPALSMVLPGRHHIPSALYSYVAFPALMPIFQQAYLFVRRILVGPVQESSVDKHTGYIVLQLTYLSAFMVSSVSHIYLVILPALANPGSGIGKIINLIKYLYRFYIPPTGIFVPLVENTTAESGIIHFVQMDILVVFSAIWIAMLWDLHQRRQEAHETSKSANQTQPPRSTNWNIAAGCILVSVSAALGPGAATSALFMYREKQLEDARNGVQKED